MEALQTLSVKKFITYKLLNICVCMCMCVCVCVCTQQQRKHENIEQAKQLLIT